MSFRKRIGRPILSADMRPPKDSARWAKCLVPVVGIALFLIFMVPLCRQLAGLRVPETPFPYGTAYPLPSATPVPEGLLDLNSVDAKTLQSLPGIGPVLSESIIDYRTEHGLLLFPEQMLYVKGIGEKRWEAVREQVQAILPKDFTTRAPVAYIIE